MDIVIRHPNALHSDNVMAYDNAVSALGKICQFHRDSIDAAQVRSIFVPMSSGLLKCHFFLSQWTLFLAFVPSWSYICFWISFRIFFQKIKDIQQKCRTSLVTCYEAQVPSRYGQDRYDIS